MWFGERLSVVKWKFSVIFLQLFPNVAAIGEAEPGHRATLSPSSAVSQWWWVRGRTPKRNFMLLSLPHCNLQKVNLVLPLLWDQPRAAISGPLSTFPWAARWLRRASQPLGFGPDVRDLSHSQNMLELQLGRKWDFQSCVWVSSRYKPLSQHSLGVFLKLPPWQPEYLSIAWCRRLHLWT